MRAGVSLGSIEISLFFSFISFTLVFLSNYADDNNLLTRGLDIELIDNLFLSDMKTESKWVYENS